jgi:hypothetical protein
MDGKQTDAPSPEEQVQALYQDAETRTARAFEEFVSKPSFGTVLARSAQNVAERIARSPLDALEFEGYPEEEDAEMGRTSPTSERSER